MKENKYGGMTVNERLYESGQINEFDKAVHDKDIERVKAILKSVELNDVSIQGLLEYFELL